jgi:hypothetical protein
VNVYKYVSRIAKIHKQLLIISLNVYNTLTGSIISLLALNYLIINIRVIFMVLLGFGVFKVCAKACGRFIAGFNQGVFDGAAGKFFDADVTAATNLINSMKQC